MKKILYKFSLEELLSFFLYSNVLVDATNYDAIIAHKYSFLLIECDTNDLKTKIRLYINEFMRRNKKRFTKQHFGIANFFQDINYLGSKCIYRRSISHFLCSYIPSWDGKVYQKQVC